MNQGDIIRTDPTTRSFVHSIPTVVNPEKFCSLKEEEEEEEEEAESTCG
jgi:hypothetical protein